MNADYNECKLFISKVDPKLTRHDLEATFSQFGPVRDVYRSNYYKTFGFVTFYTREAAKACVSAGPVTVNGAHIRVAKSKLIGRDCDSDQPQRRSEAYGQQGGFHGEGAGFDVGFALIKPMTFERMAWMWATYGSGYGLAHDWPAYPFCVSYPYGVPAYNAASCAAYYAGFGSYGELGHGTAGCAHGPVAAPYAAKSRESRGSASGAQRKSRAPAAQRDAPRAPTLLRDASSGYGPVRRVRGVDASDL